MEKNEVPTEQPGGPAPQDFLAQKEFFSLISKIAAFLIGAAGIFVLFGYTIIFSFIDNVQLSGLASFQQEYYKDAAITFVADLFKSYAGHPVWFIVLFVVIAETAYFLFRSRQEQAPAPNIKFVKRATVAALVKWLVPVVLIGVIALSLNLKALPYKYGVIADIRKFVLFVMAVPLLVLSCVYLVFKFGEFMQRPFRYYYLIVLLCLGLLVSIPVSYGEYVFNIELFHVIGFDSGDAAKNESLEGLKKEIGLQGEGQVFYFMGHTSDRDVIIDSHSLEKSTMILVDRSLIKYLKISTKDTFTLRDLLMKEAAAMPVQTQAQKDLKVRVVTEELPDDIRALLRKE